MEERNYKSEQIQFIVGLLKFLPESKIQQEQSRDNGAQM